MSDSLYVPTAAPREEARRRTEAALYGREREVPTVLTDADVRDYWVGEFRERVRADKDCVVLATGPAGSGKSTSVLDLAWRIDPTFTPGTLAERVAFRPEHIPTIYKRTPPYGVAWVDEAVTAGLLATDTFSPDQKDLVQLVNIIRAHNVVLFLVVPYLSDLAKSMRARRADYRIEVTPAEDTETGRPEAHVGRKVRGRQFFLDDGRWLGFHDDDTANPLRWPDYRSSSDARERAFWAAYYPLKLRYLDDAVDAIEARMDAREEKRRMKKAARGTDRGR